MNIETAKDLALLAAPLIQQVIDTFVKDKLETFKKKNGRRKRIIDHFFEDKFRDYLIDSYEKNAVLNTIAFRKSKVLLNNVYVPLTLKEQVKGGDQIKVIDFQDSLFSKSDKILVIDNAGMGKSTLSKKILLSCIEKNKGVPIIIELRRLSKNKGIIDEMLEQINPINEEINKQFILDLIKRGDFIFILDGYDEIPLAERSAVTAEVQKFVLKASKNRIILTSRPEDSLTSFGDFQKFGIKPLEKSEAFDLLRRYDSNGELSELLIQKVSEEGVYDGIKEYLATPLLASLLYSAFQYKQKVPFQKHVFYRQVYDALYESHDLSKGESYERDKLSGLDSVDFHRFLRRFGFMCLKSDNKIEFTHDQLVQIIQEVINGCSNLNVSPSDLIKDLTITVPIFVKDGIYFKWAHKSLQEYFTAQFIHLDTKDKQAEILKYICFHPKNYVYLNVIDLYKSIDSLGFEQEVVFEVLSTYNKYLEKSYVGYDSHERLARQEYTFVYSFALVNISYEESRGDKRRSVIFDLVREKLGDNTGTMSVTYFNRLEEERVSNIKVVLLDKPMNTLLRFLHEKGVDYVKKRRKNFDQEIPKVDLKLPSKKVHLVDERKNSILNKGENFKKTNQIVNAFLNGYEFYTIEKVGAAKELKRLALIKKQRQEDSILDF